MLSWRLIATGKHWIETEAFTLFPESEGRTLTTTWTAEKGANSMVHNLTLSSGLVDATIPFPAKVLKAARKDDYVQRRIRHRLKKTLRILY